MRKDESEIAAAALRRFTERFRSDADFRSLVRRDARAALTLAGIAVPPGIRVHFASCAANALNMTLSGGDTQNAGCNDEAYALDDSELDAVMGGTAIDARPAAIDEFLRVFKNARA